MGWVSPLCKVIDMNVQWTSDTSHQGIGEAVEEWHHTESAGNRQLPKGLLSF